jgi:predicted ATPase/DNA-binding XRE family transcriptional regulator
MEKDSPASIGVLLRQQRLARELTQEELAERTGLSRRVISEIERGGSHMPRRDTVALLARALGLTGQNRATFVAAAQAHRHPADPTAALSVPSGASPLPAPLTPLIGRAREEHHLLQLLQRPDLRLLTLSGPGGVGKTRLGLHIASLGSAAFADGVFFVPLAPLREFRLVAAALAQALGLKPSGRIPILAQLIAALSGKRLLLFLDNFEHVLEAAPLVTTLLAACAGLKVLVTSRAMLHVYGEQEYPVAPLALPPTAQAPERAALARTAAVAFFVHCVQRMLPDFTLTDDNAPAVAEICVRLDGLPLPIELAAAQSKLLPPPALLARLTSPLQILRGGARDLPARQQSLRSTLSWSFNVLLPDEQMLFARMSVFAGGCSLAAAEAVCGTADGVPGALAQGIAALLDKSMLQRDQTGSEPRVMMLETVREYAQERLAEGDAATVRARHAAYYLALAEEAEHMLRQTDQREWYDRLATEHPNLRAAAHWFMEHGPVHDGLRLVAALTFFAFLRGHVEEWRQRLTALLARPEATAPTPQRARALIAAGFLAWAQWDRAVAQSLYAESLLLFQQLDDRLGQAEAAYGSGLVAFDRQMDTVARTHLEESLVLYRAVGDLSGSAWALTYLGLLAGRAREDDRARALHEESLQIRRRIGDRQGQHADLDGLAALARRADDARTAMALLEEALAICRALDDKPNTAALLLTLGDVGLDRGDIAAAQRCYAPSIMGYRQLGDAVSLAALIARCASLAVLQGQPERALRLGGAAVALRHALGQPFLPAEADDLERRLQAARRALSEAEATAAWSVGHTMTLEQALADAGGAP